VNGDVSGSGTFTVSAKCSLKVGLKVDLVPRQATFARIEMTRSASSSLFLFRQIM
jgi:hypothetical protein